MTLKTEPHSQKELEEYLKELSPVTHGYCRRSHECLGIIREKILLTSLSIGSPMNFPPYV